MSQEIICTNCQFGNPNGSKFCSNCGEKLPQSANIVCPHCSTLNESDRVFCDNCGRRIVQDDTPLSQDDPEDSDDQQSGPQAFSLPTRKPGETGDLNPGLLPEWLRTGEHSVPDLDENGEPIEETADQPKISTDELTNIEDIKSENALTDDLPDWLLDQIDSEPIIPQSAGITTELYLDLVNNPDLPEIEDEVTSIGDELGADEANLPNWLQEPAGDKSDSDDDFDDSSEPVDFESDVDVLAGLTDILKEQTNELIPPDESGIGLTDWLSESADEEGGLSEDGLENSGVGLTDWLNDSATLDDSTGDLGSTTQGSGLTDILNDPDSLIDSDFLESGQDNQQDELHIDADEPDPSSGQSGEGAGLTDWLTNLEELGAPNEGEDWLDELSGQEAGASDWLEGLDKLTESQMNLEEPSSEEDDFEEDWLANLADSQGPSAGASDEDGSLSVTDWLTEPDGIEKFEEQVASQKSASDSDVSDAMDVLFSDEFANDSSTSTPEESADFAKEHGNLPGWLSDVPEDNQEDETAQSELDWMFETGDLELPEEGDSSAQEGSLEEALFDDSRQDDALDDATQDDSSDDSFDWLSDMKDIQTGTLEVPDAPDEITADPAEEEQISGPIEIEPELPEVPEQLQEEDDWTFERSGAKENPLPESLPDWMDELGPPMGDEATEGFDSEENEEIESELPEWLTQMRPGEEGLIGSSLPSALNPDLVDENALELPNLPMELEKADLPDWLGNQADGLLDILENESKDIPEWLAESESSDSRSGSKSEWDSSLLDKLPPPQSGPELAEANIPDWLEKFKPEELKTGESILESTSGLVLVEDELQDSAIAGLSGIIKIESLILPSKPATAPSVLQISSDQTKQIDLLRQLMQEDETAEGEVLVDTAVALPNLWNALIIFLIMIPIGIIWASPQLFPLTIDTPELVSNQAYSTLEKIEGETVLVAFEHTPAMNGELNYQNEAMLSLLQANGNEIIAVTQHPTTVGIIVDYEQIKSDNLIFLPGEAVGLRLLGDCMNRDTSACLSIPALSIVSQSDIEKIILVTSERDSLINWIEQVGSVARDKTIILSTTSALEPVARPYELSGQLDGIMTHQVFAAQNISEEITGDRLRQQANASAAAQVMAILFLIVVLVVFTVLPSRRKEEGRSS